MKTRVKTITPDWHIPEYEPIEGVAYQWNI
jgi:hypothetical protein